MKKYFFLFLALIASMGLVLSCSKQNKEDDNKDKITISRVVGVWVVGSSSNTLTIKADGTVKYSYSDAVFSPNEDGSFHQGDSIIYSDAYWEGYIDDQLVFHFTYQYIANEEVKYPNTFLYNPLNRIWTVARLRNSDMIMDIHENQKDGKGYTEVTTWHRIQ